MARLAAHRPRMERRLVRIIVERRTVAAAAADGDPAARKRLVALNRAQIAVADRQDALTIAEAVAREHLDVARQMVPAPASPRPVRPRKQRDRRRNANGSQRG